MLQHEQQTLLEEQVDFSIIRYAQCWEDADVLLDALDIQPGDSCLSIASAGDNTLSMLASAPRRVVAVDLSQAQLACLEIRVAAYRSLDHSGWLELLGARPSRNRPALYASLRNQLSPPSRAIWDARPEEIQKGIGGAGKLERYLELLRRFVLPLTHTAQTRSELFVPKSIAERRRFYEERWNTRRWRALLSVFLSRTVMGRMGRDPRFFRYVEDDVASSILRRIEHALTELDPSENPYLHWIVFGTYGEALPHALREASFEAIRENLDRLQWYRTDLKSYLSCQPSGSIDRFNLSDVYEYLSEAQSEQVMAEVARCGRSGARVAYWNLMVPRSTPASLRHRVHPATETSDRGTFDAKAFFYNAFVLEEIS